MQHYVLGDVITEISERENNPSNSAYERFVGLEHYVSGEVEIENYGSTANLTSAMKVFNSGDILVARRNVYLKRASVVYFDGLTSGDSIVLRPKDETIGRILPFILNTDDFWDYADQYSDGTMSKRLSPKVLKQYEFDLPDDNLEQLADILWAMVDVKKSYQQLLKQTDELVKSQFIEMFGDPFENPKGYKKVTIGDVCEFQGGSQPPRKEFVFKPQEGYVRLIQIRDYKTDDYITYAPEKMCRKFCTADDIMIGRYGPPIFQILQGIEGAYNVALMKAIPHGVNKEFMRTYLKRDELLHHLEMFSTRTAGQAGIEMKELRGYPFLLPPEEEQLEYVKFVEQSDKSKFELKQAIEGVDLLIKSMIQQELN